MDVAQAEKETETKIQTMAFNWMDNLSIQKLLDVIVSIISDEYIRVAKQNPEVFRSTPRLSAPGA